MKHDLKEMVEMLERYRNRIRYDYNLRVWLNKKGISCEWELDKIHDTKATLRRALG